MLFKSIFKRKKKRLKEKPKYQFDIISWMTLTKEERIAINVKENDESMRKKKALIKTIRNEYNKIKKINK